MVVILPDIERVVTGREAGVSAALGGTAWPSEKVEVKEAFTGGALASEPPDSKSE